MDWLDIILRLGVAAAIGGIIGLNRDIHGKQTGLRTLGLVGLGAALAVVAAQYPGAAHDAGAGSRVMQGVITGIGFLGAGVIMRRPTGERVHGLTTAAAIWVTACLGLLSGLGAWRIVTVAAVLVLLFLTLGGPLEKAIHRRIVGEPEDVSASGDEGPQS